MKKLTTVLLLFCLHLVHSQNKTRDSLFTALKTESRDTSKVVLLNKIAGSYYKAFVFDSALTYLKKSLPIAIRSNFKREESLIYNITGAINYYKGNYDSSLYYYGRSLSIREKLGDKKGMAISYSNIAGVYANTGRYSESLKNAEMALKLNLEIKDGKGIAKSYNSIGEAYRMQGNYPEATKNYFMGLRACEKINEPDALWSLYNNLAIVYQNQKQDQEALKYYNKALELHKAHGDKKGSAAVYHNIAIVYKKQKNYAEAIKNFSLALSLNTEIGNRMWLANNYTGMASMYATTNELPLTTMYLKKALEIREEIGDKSGIANANSALATIYIQLHDYKEAKRCLDKSLAIAKEIHSLNEIESAYENIYRLDSSESRFKDAFEHSKLFVTYRDSLINEENSEKILQSRMQYDFDKKEAAAKLEQDKKDAIAIEESKKKNIILWSVCGILALVLGFAVYAYKSYLQKQKANIEITLQKHIIEEKQKEILDSINYAKRLQEAILPPLELVRHFFPASFVLFNPKDIVAGDFYWMHVSGEMGVGSSESGDGSEGSGARSEESGVRSSAGKVVFVAAADCTGHGVPGAMVSVVCSTALNRAVNEFNLTDPGKILDKARELVLETFSKSDKDVKDGMDISLISIFKNNNSDVFEIKWAGANNPLWYIRGGEIFPVQANKQSIGKTDSPVPFTTHSFELNTGDSVFLFTDGFADQFGGPKGKKFKYQTLQDLLVRNAHLNPEEQKNKLQNAFSEWRGNLEQVDDICVMGIKF